MTTTIEQRFPHRLGQIIRVLLAHTGVSITDIYGNIVYASPAFCEECGYSEEELLGRNHSMLKSSVHSDSYYAFLWATISSGNPWQGELCNTRKNGEPYWVERKIIPILDDDNNPEYYVGVGNEISQQKALTRKLKTRIQQQGLIAILGRLSISTRPISAFVEQALNALCSTLGMNMGLVFETAKDQRQATLMISTGMQHPAPGQLTVPLSETNLLGYTCISGHPVISRQVEKDSRFVLPDFLQDKGQQSVLSLRIGDELRLQGLMVLSSDQPLKLVMEDAFLAQSVCNLISEAMLRHDMETRVMREKELSRKCLDAANIIIVVLDEQGRIILANRETSTLLGLDAEDLPGLNWFDYFVPYRERETVRQDFLGLMHGRLTESDDPVQLETPVITRQARTRRIRWHNTVIRDPLSNSLSLLCTGEDISESD